MIDTGTLSERIAALRKLTQKNSISPEMVGDILQNITDILATAGTQANLDIINTWYNTLKQAPVVISSMTRGSYDRNDFLVNIDKLSLGTGAVTSSTNYTLIPQATTEHSGMMRAQQVTDLNSLRTAVNSTILPTLETIKSQISSLQTVGTTASATTVHLVCEVVDGSLVVRGASKLLSAGYVPYLFRSSRRRTRDRDHDAISNPKKGWHLFGSKHTIRVYEDGKVEFSKNTAEYIHTEPKTYSCNSTAFLHIKTDSDGHKYVPWGLSRISLYDKKAQKNRMVRLTYAIGFAKEKPVGRTTITGDDLVSNLAQFSVVYDREADAWSFSR